MDGKITSKICTTVDGGWLDDAGHGSSAERALATLQRLRAALESRAKAAFNEGS